MQKPSKGTLALIALMVTIVGIGAGVYFLGEDPDTTSGTLSDPEQTTDPVESLNNPSKSAVITTPDFTLKPRDGYRYQRKIKGTYTQVNITPASGTEAIGVIISQPTTSTGLGELAGLYSGGYQPHATDAPLLKETRIAGKPAFIMHTTDDDSLITDVYAFALVKPGVSVTIHLRGTEDNLAELEASAKLHAAAITATK